MCWHQRSLQWSFVFEYFYLYLGCLKRSCSGRVWRILWMLRGAAERTEKLTCRYVLKLQVPVLTCHWLVCRQFITMFSTCWEDILLTFTLQDYSHFLGFFSALLHLTTMNFSVGCWNIMRYTENNWELKGKGCIDINIFYNTKKI